MTMLKPALQPDTARADADALWTKLRELAPLETHPRLEAAYELACAGHEGQWRKTAEGAARVPYIVHPLRVALIVAGEWQETQSDALAACLLHDVLEDCPWEQRDFWEQSVLKAEGEAVYNAVCTLSKPAPGPAEVKASRDARYFAELFLAPQWVRMVKCADRVDNLRDAANWGNLAFWERYSSETVGWHLYLARETAPIAEVALFKALVDGERRVKGCVPIWADGHMIDPIAAALIPEHIARLYGVIGLALQGQTLIVGMLNPDETHTLECIRMTLPGAPTPAYTLRAVAITPEALDDALAARMYGQVGA